MNKKIKTKTTLKKRFELGGAAQDKITNQKKSWSQKRVNMETDINEETYSEEFINFKI